MKAISTATAGLVALSAALSANSYVLPNSIGDQRFAEQEAGTASSEALGATFAKRNEGEPIKLALSHSKREALDTFDKVKKFAQNQKNYIEHKYGSQSLKEKRQIAGLVDYGTDRWVNSKLLLRCEPT